MMFKISTIAVAIAVTLSLSANAANYHTDAGIQHQKVGVANPVSIVDTSVVTGTAKPLTAKNQYSAKSYSASSTDDGIVPQSCTVDEMTQYAGAELAEYFSNAYLFNDIRAGYECFRPLFEEFEESNVVFSQANQTVLIDALLADLNSGDALTEKTFGKLMYFRTAYFNKTSRNGNFQLSSDIEAKVKQAFDLIFEKVDYGSTTIVDQIILSEAVNLSGSWYTFLDFMDFAGGDARIADNLYLMDEYADILNAVQPLHTADFTDTLQYSLYVTANSVINEVNRQVRYFNGELVADNAVLPGILAKYVYATVIDDPAPSNAVYSLLSFTAFGSSDELIAAIQEVLDAEGKFSEMHIATLRAISAESLDCTTFGRDDLLCAGDELVGEMRAFALPNTFTFGDITFLTKMSEERTREIYNSLQATRAQFFRDTGVTEAVSDDPNANPTFVVYASPDDYQAFHGFLYNLDTNNGGIYIEQDGTLYTFDRPDTEMFVLEELARHEYTHYLISRYLVNGMWGETEMYENNRMVWFDEGLANYMTSASQHEGTSPLRTMIDMQQSSSETRTISDVTQTTYNDSWMYPYSALVFNYLESIDSDVLVTLSKALVEDDITEFDSVVSSLASLDSGFQTYIGGLNKDEAVTPWYDYPMDAFLEDDGVDTIRTVLTTSMGSDVTCTETDEINFSCSFNIDAAGDTFTQVGIVNSVLDAGIVEALSEGPNNAMTLTCYPTSFGVSGVAAECIGLLRPDGVAFDDGTEEPVDTDGDGVPDDEDAFPNDPTEWADTDGDGYGDNSDVFPNDSTEWLDSDSDGHGDNSDAFPNDASEWADTDGDGYGDNSDAFPQDSAEWVDTDGDGHGDNSDYYPNDASKWEQETTTTPTAPTSEAKASGGSFGFSIIAMILLGFTRYRKR